MFERVGVKDLTEGDLKKIIKITSLHPFGYNASDVMKAEMLGLKQIWRFDKGLLITMISSHPGGKELLVWGLAGRGVFKPGFKEACWELARKLNCRWISAGTTGAPQARLYAMKLGIKPRGVCFFEEV